jgi:hypothetical protein
VIVCLRTVAVPPEWRERYLAWIDAGRAIRQQHGILAELVCEPASPAGDTRRHSPSGQATRCSTSRSRTVRNLEHSSAQAAREGRGRDLDRCGVRQALGLARDIPVGK